MRKLFFPVLASLLLIVSLAGCSSTTEQSQDSTPNPEPVSDGQTQTPNEAPTASGSINVVSREDGSGTRGAFIELFGVEVKNDDGDKVDMTAPAAEITHSTSVMMTTVAGDPNAIGYISLGSLNDTVKALQIDGVAATVDNINNGSYGISRPFNIATTADTNAQTQEFISFIMSTEGQDIVEAKGYIRVEDTGAFESSGASGKVVVAGSSSVTPVMEALSEAFASLNPEIDIEIQQSDSSTGMNAAMEGICDIGMASRDLKDSELESLTDLCIAMDGIAVIVNNSNPSDGLSKEQVRAIFTGEITDWSEAG